MTTTGATMIRSHHGWMAPACNCASKPETHPQCCYGMREQGIMHLRCCGGTGLVPPDADWHPCAYHGPDSSHEEINCAAKDHDDRRF